MGLKLTSGSFKDLRSSGTKKHAKLLTGTQYRLGKLGTTLVQAYRNIDTGFNTIEDEERVCTTVNANKIISRSVTITAGNTSVTDADALAAGAQNSSKPSLAFRTDSGAAESQTTRYTCLLQNDGDVIITARDANGDAVDPGVNVTISYLADQR